MHSLTHNLPLTRHLCFSFGDNHCVVEAFELILREVELLLQEPTPHLTRKKRDDGESNKKKMKKRDWHVAHLPSGVTPSSADMTKFWESMMIGLPPMPALPPGVTDNSDWQTTVLPEYVVVMNPCYGCLVPSDMCPAGYRLLSFISFEELGQVPMLLNPTGKPRIISHFTCLAFSEDNSRYFLFDDLLSLRPGGWQGGMVDSKRSAHCYSLNISHFAERVPICIFQRIHPSASPSSPTPSPPLTNNSDNNNATEEVTEKDERRKRRKTLHPQNNLEAVGAKRKQLPPPTEKKPKVPEKQPGKKEDRTKRKRTQ